MWKNECFARSGLVRNLIQYTRPRQALFSCEDISQSTKTEAWGRTARQAEKDLIMNVISCSEENHQTFSFRIAYSTTWLQQRQTRCFGKKKRSTFTVRKIFFDCFSWSQFILSKECLHCLGWRQKAERGKYTASFAYEFCEISFEILVALISVFRKRRKSSIICCQRTPCFLARKN